MTLDASACVENQNDQTFTFSIEIWMSRNVRFPIVCGLVRGIAPLHVFGGGTFSQRNDFPLLRLSWEFDRLDDLVDGLRRGCGASSGDEVFCCVHVLRFVLKERDCSLHPPRESSSAPD